MKTYRVEFLAPRSHFEITYDNEKSVDDYEFWGEKFSVTNHQIINAQASIEIPSSWTMVGSNNDAEAMAAGDRFYGEFTVDIPAESIQADTLDEWLDILCDQIPANWDINDAWTKDKDQI